MSVLQTDAFPFRQVAAFVQARWSTAATPPAQTSTVFHMDNRIRQTLAAGAVFLGSGIICVGSASAHAVASLNGAHAVAGKSGVLGLTLQHGCAGGYETDTVVTTFSSAFRSVKPRPVGGWTSQVSRVRGGKWKATWKVMGAPIPFAQPFTFTLAVSWPKRSGVYTAPTMQYCGPHSSAWVDTYTGPADGVHTSPANMPVPEILVKPAARTAVPVSG